jgi:rubrerythrin
MESFAVTYPLAHEPIIVERCVTSDDEVPSSSLVRPLRTTLQWWNDTRAYESKIIDWLRRQFHGEAYAVKLMTFFLEKFARNEPEWACKTLRVIVQQEALHAKWIGELLRRRGVEPTLLQKKERYWNEVRPYIDSFESYCAAIKLVESMALHKDIVISSHPDTPGDIREVFRRLRVDETFHAGFYGLLARPDELERMRVHHDNGMQAIGLQPGYDEDFELTDLSWLQR